MRVAGLLLLIGCGRSGFDPVGDARLAGPAVPDAPTLPDGLVAWYPMEVVADGGVVDHAGPHDGTCAPGGCPALTGAGRIGRAYVFDGVDDLLRVPSVAALETAQGFTVSAWIRRAAGSPHGCIFNKGYGTLNVNSWQACIEDSGKLSFYSASTVDAHQQTSVLLERERWYHVTLWWDGRTKATYVDAALVAAETGLSIAFDDRPVTLGADLDEAKLVLAFRGEIDDVRIYNRALAAAELAALSAAQ